MEVALGNGNTTIRDYNAATGYLESVLTGTTLGTEAQSLSFAWDKVGNLISRTDENQNGLVEDFQYDNLNRLIQATITQGPSYIEPLYVDCDDIGNIVYKSDVGEYNYNTRPHAVSEVIDGPRNATYSYDANGNMTSGADRAIQWTAFNKPRAIVRDANPPSGTFYNGGTLSMPRTPPRSSTARIAAATSSCATRKRMMVSSSPRSFTSAVYTNTTTTQQNRTKTAPISRPVARPSRSGSNATTTTTTRNTYTGIIWARSRP
ncbi:RHS repeat domain-containing protein [Salinisphaera shabanensis]|uniref:RHS repeat domain-containing protein n=1 Tax=Salinisphaera shabanensis TaxID=180542 RepID=UPI0003116261|nr:RHS repeat domain-containing protein [Salinisphaera shabanensis]